MKMTNGLMQYQSIETSTQYTLLNKETSPKDCMRMPSKKAIAIHQTTLVKRSQP
jgi:hypothetical protein